ncbi:MAG: triosephosphate isomerase [Parcubacteria group bacterium]|nr:triosephosphate isomerase [Parcubacteria group bacterium]
MARQLIVANWKMNPASEQEAERLLRAAVACAKKYRRPRIIVAPPFPYLSRAKRLIGRNGAIALAAQDAFWEKEGAYTGEVSPAMLKKLGVSYVILGHSERREHLGETNAMINRKVRAALKIGLRVILCVGERERAPDGNVFSDFVKTELTEGLAGAPRRLFPGLIIAYEPICLKPLAAARWERSLLFTADR